MAYTKTDQMVPEEDPCTEEKKCAFSAVKIM